MDRIGICTSQEVGKIVLSRIVALTLWMATLGPQ